MANPYNWSFPQRDHTMFLATIEASRESVHHARQPSFQKQDIPGAHPRQQIPQQVRRQNYAYSAYIQPIPKSHVMKNRYIGSSNLRTDDIEGAQPQCSDFKTYRVTNPIVPKYKLPYVPSIDPEPPRKFIKDPLDISDIKTKSYTSRPVRSQKEQIEGSSPAKLFRTVDAVSRLDVKDINRDGSFISKRTEKPTNPLEPTYTWRESRQQVNNRYGEIGNHPRKHFQQTNKRLDFSLNANDIQGAKANSYYDRRLFLSKRRQCKDSLNIDDIPKTHASSLKKGISTERHVNPLMPQYKYPSVFY